MSRTIKGLFVQMELSNNYEEKVAAKEQIINMFDDLKKLLKEHHDWHLDFGKVPKEFVDMDMSAEYCDSDMCERTVKALY